MIRHICSCGKSYQLKDDMVGRKVKCPACQAVLTVVPQAELVPVAPPPGAIGAAGLTAIPHDPLASLTPLGSAHPFGDPLASRPVLSPFVAQPSPQVALGGLQPAQPMSTSGKPQGTGGYPLWVWIATGVSGVAAVGAMILLVVVVVRINRPNSGNRVANVPTNVPAYEPARQADSSAPVAIPSVRVGRTTIGEDIGHWQIYSSDSGGYEINLPGKPQVLPQSMSTPFGTVKGGVVIVGSESAGMIVTVAHVDVPYDSARLPIDQLVELTVQQQQGTIGRTSDVQISGRPGKEYVVNFEIAGLSRSKGLYRALGIGKRVYTLGYITPPARFDEAAARKCLETFAITKEPPAAEAAFAPAVAGPGIPVQSEVAWVKHESQKGRFRVDLPAPATNISALVGIPNNKYAEGMACEIAGKGAFVVTANAHSQPLHPDTVPSFLDSLRPGLAKRGKTVSESTSKLGDFTVVDIVLDAPNGARELIRLYVSQEWFYDVKWLGPTAEVGSEEVNRFFNSFAILPASGQPAATPATSSSNPSAAQPATAPAPR